MPSMDSDLQNRCCSLLERHTPATCKELEELDAHAIYLRLKAFAVSLGLDLGFSDRGDFESSDREPSPEDVLTLLRAETDGVEPVEPVELPEISGLESVPVVSVIGDQRVLKWGKNQGRKWSSKLSPRKPEKVYAITIHQMATTVGVSRRMLKAFDGDREEARRVRMGTMAAHYCATTSGEVVKARPLEHHVHHGNGSNRRSIGIEIEGFYPGLKSERGPQHTEWTERTKLAARRAVGLAIEEAKAWGAEIVSLTVHRAWHRSRIADPGEEIYVDVCLWAEEAHDLKIDLDFAAEYITKHKPSGKRIPDIALPVPKQWDPRSKHEYKVPRSRELRTRRKRILKGN